MATHLKLFISLTFSNIYSFSFSFALRKIIYFYSSVILPSQFRQLKACTRKIYRNFVIRCFSRRNRVMCSVRVKNHSKLIMNECIHTSTFILYCSSIRTKEKSLLISSVYHIFVLYTVIQIFHFSQAQWIKTESVVLPCHLVCSDMCSFFISILMFLLLLLPAQKAEETNTQWKSQTFFS